MIFQHTWQQVLDGSKTQTRRLVKPRHIKAGALNVLIPYVYTRPDYGGGFMGHRKLWEVGKTYAVQPGRSQKAVGRIRITGIRQESLQDISFEDQLAEGLSLCQNCGGSGVDVYERTIAVPSPYDFDVAIPQLQQYQDYCEYCRGNGTAEHSYAHLWDSIHTAPGTRWDDNPDVWVLTFELVEAQS